MQGWGHSGGRETSQEDLIWKSGQDMMVVLTTSVAVRVMRKGQHPDVCVRICPWKWGIREEVKEDYKDLDLNS